MMTSVTFKNSTKDITVEDAVKLNRLGISTIINDGKDVTFEIETLSSSTESTRRN